MTRSGGADLRGLPGGRRVALLVAVLLLLSSLAVASAWPAPPLVTADGDVRLVPSMTVQVPANLPRQPGAPPGFPLPPSSMHEGTAREPAPEQGLLPPVVGVVEPQPLATAAGVPSDRSLEAPASTNSRSETGDTPVVPDVPTVDGRIEAQPSREQPWLGAQVDVGFPDGVGASAMVMPWDWLRVQVGGSWNGAARGVRAGLVALLFPSFFKSVRPTVSVEGGYAFDTDSRWLVDLVEDPVLKGALSRVTVLHGGGHLGLEFGSKYFSFFLRGGVSYVDVQLGGYEGDSAALRGLELRGLFPSGKLGFLVCWL